MMRSAGNDWYLSDKTDFRSGTETIDEENDEEALYLKSIVARPKAFGFLSKQIPPDDYLGKRLLFSAQVKTQLPEGASAQLWVRVDGDWKVKPSYFDNMYESRIKGDTEWCRYAVVVDVPKTSQKITYGILLNGTGRVWMNDVLLECVEGFVALVGREKLEHKSGSRRTYSSERNR